MGFSLRSSMRNTKVSYEEFDENGLEIEGSTDEVLEQIETAETASANATEAAELEGDMATSDKAEALDNAIEDTVEDAEAVIEAADEEAAETKDEPFISVKDVAVMQERVRTILTMVDGEGVNFVLSKESASSDGYNTFKVNLEGLKEIGEKVKNFLVEIWRKIVETFDRVVSYIKRLLPTKLNRLRALVKELNALDKSKKMKKEDGYSKAASAFAKSTLKAYAGAATLIGVNLDKTEKYTTNCLSTLEKVSKNLKDAGDLRNIDDKSTFRKKFGLLIKSSTIGGTDIKVNAKEAAREELTNEVVNDAVILAVAPAGDKVVYTISAEVSKAADKDEDDERDNEVFRVITHSVAVPEFKESDVKFEIGDTANKLSELLKSSDKYTSAVDKFNSEIKKFRKDVVDSTNGNMFTKWSEGRAAEKAIRKFVNENIRLVTKYDGEILSYAIAYGRACLAAYIAGKEK